MNDENELILYAVYKKNSKTGEKILLCRTLEKERAEALMKTAYGKSVNWSTKMVAVALHQMEGELET